MIIISVIALTISAILFERILIKLMDRIFQIEDRLKLSQDGELKRMLAKANESIADLKKENKQLKLYLEMDEMDKALER